MVARRINSFCFALIAILPTQVSAAVPASGKCNDPAILQEIMERFSVSAPAESGVNIRHIRSPRLRYQVVCEPMARTHDQCSGDVVLSDGSVRKLFYSVETRFALISRPAIVHFCIGGVYPVGGGNKNCAILQ